MEVTPEELDALIPEINIGFFNLTTTDLNNQTVNVTQLNIPGLDLVINGTDIINQLNITNAQIQGGNITVDPSSLIRTSLNLTVAQLINIAIN